MGDASLNKDPQNLSGRRKIFLYVLFTIFIVALFLSVLEFLARSARKAGLVNFERPDDRVAYAEDPFIRVTINGVKYYESASQWMVTSRFLVEKPRNLYRIFILGESFAMGTPYVTQGGVNDKGGMDSWIKAELEILGLGERFEIINAAAGAQNSFSVKNFAKAACDCGADLIIISTGNNEGYLPPTELNILLNKLSSYRLLKKAILREAALDERPLTAPKNKSPELISAAFKKNLEEIILYARKKGVAVALATLPINLRGVVSVSNSELSKEYLEDLRLRREGRFQEALDSFWKLPESGAKYFQIGKCLDGLGRFEDAFQAYTTAVTIEPDNRMLPTHNDMIQDLVKEHNLILVDLESRIRSMAKNRIPGMEQFLDYCHMRWQYYAACADEVTFTLRNLGIMPAKKVPWNDFNEKVKMLLKQMNINELYLRSFEPNPHIFEGYEEEDDYWVNRRVN